MTKNVHVHGVKRSSLIFHSNTALYIPLYSIMRLVVNKLLPYKPTCVRIMTSQETMLEIAEKFRYDSFYMVCDNV